MKLWHVNSEYSDMKNGCENRGTSIFFLPLQWGRYLCLSMVLVFFFLA